MITFAQYLGSLREAMALDSPDLESKLTWKFDSPAGKVMTFDFQGDVFEVLVHQELLGEPNGHEIIDLYAESFSPKYFDIMFSSRNHMMDKIGRAHV